MSELIDRQALRAAHGLGSDCHDCKRDMKSCQYDRDYSLMDFCEWLDDAPTASPWHRVEDGDLPKNGESVLVYCETTGGIIKSTYSEFVKDGKRIYSRFGGQLRKYWMPLPEPPKEDAWNECGRTGKYGERREG